MPSREESLLGKSTDYIFEYDADLLFPIPRKDNRETLGINDNNLPFVGVDRWTAYEFSWLNRHGKPQVAILEFDFPCHSPNIIESKSFKLYLNSFNQTFFSCQEQVLERLHCDLSSVSGADVSIFMHTVNDFPVNHLDDFENLDDHNVVCEDYKPNSDLLELSENSELICRNYSSNLLRSLCPVTGQPDWASLYIQYKGREITPQSLLKYIVSYRNHQGFHEQCVEQIYTDLYRVCSPEELMVYARYTRRGGLDINPFRCNHGMNANLLNLRLARQ